VTCLIMLTWLHGTAIVGDVAVLINFTSNVFCATIAEFPYCLLVASHEC
jgi:hypothetical protein